MEDEEEKDIIEADLQFEDSGEDDWEDVEDVVQRADSDEEELGEDVNEEDWEDDDSDGENEGQM